MPEIKRTATTTTTKGWSLKKKEWREVTTRKAREREEEEEEEEGEEEEEERERERERKKNARPFAPLTLRTISRAGAAQLHAPHPKQK